MLTEPQITAVWERKLGAEIRSLYFGELTARFSRHQQWITGVSFFLSSGAAAGLMGKIPLWIPLGLSVVVALLTAYSIGVNLEKTIRTTAKLHYSWNELAAAYDLLWNHTYEKDAEPTLYELARRERDLSELATTDAPNDQRLMGKWQDHVVRQYHLTNA